METESKGRLVMGGLTLKDVLHRVIFENDLTPRQMAEQLGVSYSMLTNAANPELDSFKFAARHVIPLTKLTKDFRLLDFMEASCGRVAFSLPEIPKRSQEIDRLVANNVQLFGNVLADIGLALEDGRIDGFEIKRIEADLLDQVRTAMALLEALKKQHRESAA